MHKNEALPCPAGLDPASHPVDAVGTRRVALGHASRDCGAKPARTRALVDTVANWRNIFRQLGKYFFLTGEKKLGNYTKALSTSCESTFIGLRKYIQQLMKALSKKVTLYLLLVIHFHLIGRTSSEDAQSSIYITIYPDGFCQACVDQMIGKRSI